MYPRGEKSWYTLILVLAQEACGTTLKHVSLRPYRVQKSIYGSPKTHKDGPTSTTFIYAEDDHQV
jgi:hypothetical protein